MKDNEKTLGHLDQELSEIQRRIQRLEKLQSDLRHRSDSRQEAERLYAALAEQSLDAVYLLKDGKFEYINTKFQDLFGLTREEMLRPDFDFMSIVAPESRKFINDRLQRSLRGEPLSPRYEFTARKRDGQHFKVEVSYAYVPYQGEIATQGTFRLLKSEASSVLEDPGIGRELQADHIRFIAKAPFGIYRSSPAGRFLSVNPAMASLFGYSSPEEMLESIVDIGKQVYVNSGDRLEFLRRLNERGSLTGFESQQCRKNGTRIWVSESAWCERDENGNILYYEGTVEDITGRRDSEEEAHRQLEEMQASGSSILAAIPHAVFGLEGDRIIFVNDHAETVFGWTPAELIGREIRVLFRTDEEFKKMVERTQAVLEKKPFASLEIESPCVRKNGGEILCRISVAQAGNSGGEKIVATFEDVTERKKAEEVLNESERRLKNIIDFLPDPTFAINSQREVIAWNRAIETMTGIKAATILGKKDYEYALPFYGERRPILIDYVLSPQMDTDEGIESLYQHIRKNEHSVTAESYIADTNGRSAYLAATAAALFDSKKNIIGAIQSVRDITDQKRSERAQKELEAELLQAQKMEAVGTLAGGIAHDFNNLLMGIQGYTSLMLLGMEPDHPFYKKLKNVEEQVQSGADLTRQLLGFARGGRYEVRPTDLNEIVEKTSLMFGRTKKEVIVQKKLAKDLWLVDADIGQIEQVLLNLYVNSWQAMPGGGELFLSTENVYIDEKFVLPFQTKPGHYVKISITDTGVGMDEKTRQRVFEPFFTTKEMGRGTGLGLASAYGIIKGHGGIINVYSEKGHGATFTIYLPASDSQLIEEKGDQSKILRGNETILLVDDEESVIEVSREILETLGYRVLTAASGKEAIELYEKRMDEIDLVILDMIIPEMGGGEIFDILRSLNPAVRVILSSGYSMNGQAAKIMDRGCLAFIQKPFSMREISHKVREVLDRKLDAPGGPPKEGDTAGKAQADEREDPKKEADRVVKLEFRKSFKYDLR